MRRLNSLVIHGLENLTYVILGTCRSRANSNLFFRPSHMVLTGVLVELIDIISSLFFFTSLCSISRLALFQQYILRDCSGWHLILVITAVSRVSNPVVPSHDISRPGRFVRTRSSNELTLRVVKLTIWIRFLLSNVSRNNWLTSILFLCVRIEFVLQLMSGRLKSRLDCFCISCTVSWFRSKRLVGLERAIWGSVAGRDDKGFIVGLDFYGSNFCRFVMVDLFNNEWQLINDDNTTKAIVSILLCCLVIGR